MIAQVEQGITNWLMAQFGALAGESALFPTVVPGPVSGSAKAAVADGVQLRLSTEHLAPEAGDQVVGTAPVEAGITGRWQAHLQLLLEGAEAATDLAGLTLLALLREWSGPAPDLAPGAEASGLSPSGSRQVTAGNRRVDLRWSAPEPGLAEVVTYRGKRRWIIPLTTRLHFRVSPAPLEGGRILQVQAGQTSQAVVHRRHEATLYAPAEQIPLAYFGGLDGAALAALRREGMESLGDLAHLNGERADLLAARLQIPTASLTQLASVAAARQRWAESFAAPTLPEALQRLASRALVAPNTDERAELAQVNSLPAGATWLAMAAVPVAALLQDERREQIPLGSLLLVRGR